MGRGPAQCSPAGASLRRAGRGAAFREIRSRGSLRADGAHADTQCLHSADGAADVARGAEPEGAARRQHALDRIRRRISGRGNLRVGKVGVRPCHQRVLRADRVQYRAVGLRRDQGFQAGRHRPAGCRAQGCDHRCGWEPAEGR